MMKIRNFTSIRAYHDFASSPRPCRHCGQPATKDALFDVGNGIALIERYCDLCAKVIERRNGA